MIDRATLHVLLADLEPLAALASAGGDRAVPLERGPGGVSDPQAHLDALSAEGIAARARTAHGRLTRVHAPARDILTWLCAYAGARPSVEVLALHLARHRAPLPMRDELVRRELVAAARKDEAERAHKTYTTQLRPARGGRRTKSSLGAGAAVAREASDRATALATQTEAEAEALRGTLQGWGLTALASAWVAWQATEDAGSVAA